MDGNDFPGLRYLDDERLQQALQEVFIPRTRIDTGDLVGKGKGNGKHIKATIRMYNII